MGFLLFPLNLPGFIKTPVGILNEVEGIENELCLGEDLLNHLPEGFPHIHHTGLHLHALPLEVFKTSLWGFLAVVSEYLLEAGSQGHRRDSSPERRVHPS